MTKTSGYQVPAGRDWLKLALGKVREDLRQVRALANSIARRVKSILDTIDDSVLAPQTDLSSYYLAGTVTGMHRLGTYEIRGTVTTDVATGTTSQDVTAATPLPSTWRPRGTTIGSWYAQGMGGAVILRSDGTMAISNRNAISITGDISFTVTYLK